MLTPEEIDSIRESDRIWWKQMCGDEEPDESEEDKDWSEDQQENSDYYTRIQLFE